MHIIIMMRFLSGWVSGWWSEVSRYQQNITSEAGDILLIPYLTI